MEFGENLNDRFLFSANHAHENNPITPTTNSKPNMFESCFSFSNNQNFSYVFNKFYNPMTELSFTNPNFSVEDMQQNQFDNRFKPSASNSIYKNPCDQGFVWNDAPIMYQGGTSQNIENTFVQNPYDQGFVMNDAGIMYQGGMSQNIENTFFQNPYDQGFVLNNAPIMYQGGMSQNIENTFFQNPVLNFNLCQNRNSIFQTEGNDGNPLIMQNENYRQTKHRWSEEEDRQLVKTVTEWGSEFRTWSDVAKALPGRVGKQCRERWENHLRREIKKDPFTEDEDKSLIEAHKELGNQWEKIARRLPGRTANSIKNRWNSTKRANISRRNNKKQQHYPRQKPSLLQVYINSVSESTITNKSKSNEDVAPCDDHKTEAIVVAPNINDDISFDDISFDDIIFGDDNLDDIQWW